MKKVFAELGGRPFANDDLVTLQSELTAAVQAQFLGKGPFILSGCQVSGSGPAYNVAAGIVCLDGELLRFAGAGAVALPMQFQAGAAVLSDPRPYQTGGTKNCMREVPAVLVASDPTYTAGEFLPLDTWGGLRWDDVVRASVRSQNEVQQLASLATNDYEGGFTLTTGLGKPGTEAWGWALCNGNNDTADLRGMFILGYNPNRGNDGRGHNLSTTAVGDGGGEETHALTQPEMPPHTHTATVKGTGNDASTNYGEFGALQNGSNSQQQPNRTATTNSTGGASGAVEAHNNMPPYYVLAFRQWIGY